MSEGGRGEAGRGEGGRGRKDIQLTGSGKGVRPRKDTGRASVCMNNRLGQDLCFSRVVVRG